MGIAETQRQHEPMSLEAEHGVKYDEGKPRWDLLPMSQVEDVVKVLTGGSLKYSDDNWKKIPNIQDRYFSAAMRHLTAQRDGERLDRESGLPHLSHAVCCLLFMAWEEGGKDGKV